MIVNKSKLDKLFVRAYGHDQASGWSVDQEFLFQYVNMLVDELVEVERVLNKIHRCFVSDSTKGGRP